MLSPLLLFLPSSNRVPKDPVSLPFLGPVPPELWDRLSDAVRAGIEGANLLKLIPPLCTGIGRNEGLNFAYKSINLGTGANIEDSISFPLESNVDAFIIGMWVQMQAQASGQDTANERLSINNLFPVIRGGSQTLLRQLTPITGSQQTTSLPHFPHLMIPDEVGSAAGLGQMSYHGFIPTFVRAYDSSQLTFGITTGPAGVLLSTVGNIMGIVYLSPRRP